MMGLCTLAGAAYPIANGAADTAQNAALAPLSNTLSQLAALAPQLANLEPSCSASAVEVLLAFCFSFHCQQMPMTVSSRMCSLMWSHKSVKQRPDSELTSIVFM